MHNTYVAVTFPSKRGGINNQEEGSWIVNRIFITKEINIF